VSQQSITLVEGLSTDTLVGLLPSVSPEVRVKTFLGDITPVANMTGKGLFPGMSSLLVAS